MPPPPADSFSIPFLWSSAHQKPQAALGHKAADVFRPPGRKNEQTLLELGPFKMVSAEKDWSGHSNAAQQEQLQQQHELRQQQQQQQMQQQQQSADSPQTIPAPPADAAASSRKSPPPPL